MKAYRHLLVLQRNTPARSARGAEVDAWAEVAQVLGDVSPLGAREFYAAAVEANPRAEPAWANWGILEGRAARWAESERLLRRVVELRPEGAKGWYDLSVCLERQGRTNEAAEAAARATALW